MGDATRANAKRLKFELDSYSYRRKRAEAIFVGVILCVMCSIGGYIVGVKYPPSPNAVPEFARKLGKFKK